MCGPEWFNRGMPSRINRDATWRFLKVSQKGTGRKMNGNIHGNGKKEGPPSPLQEWGARFSFGSLVA